VAIPHHAVIANIIQNAAFVRLNDPTLSLDKARYRKGDVNLGVLPLFRESQDAGLLFPSRANLPSDIYGLVYVVRSP
jgi:hypothetical protein